MSVANPPAETVHDGPHRAAVALRGVFAIALGVLALMHPGYATGLVLAFGIFALVDGVIRIAATIRAAGRDPSWWLHGLEGVAGIAIGIVALRGVKELTQLAWTIAEWSFVIGLLGVVFSVTAWRRLPDAWLWLLSGVLAIVFAAWLLWETKGGLFATGFALGIFAIVYGAVSLLIAIRSHDPP